MSYANRDDTTKILLFGDSEFGSINHRQNIEKATSNLIGCDKNKRVARSIQIQYKTNGLHVNELWVIDSILARISNLV